MARLLATALVSTAKGTRPVPTKVSPTLLSHFTNSLVASKSPKHAAKS